MKKIILLLISFFLVSTNIFSQDIIYKKDNTKIEGEIIKITDSEIEYRKFTQPDGPIRVISIEKVNQINYEDGTFEVFKSVEKESTIKKVTNISPIEVVQAEEQGSLKINKKDVTVVYKDDREDLQFMKVSTGLVWGTKWNIKDKKNEIFLIFQKFIGSELDKKGISSFETNSKYNLVASLLDIFYETRGSTASQRCKIKYSLVNNATGKVLFERTVPVLYECKYKEIRKLNLKAYDKFFYFSLVENTDKLFQESNFTDFFK